MNQSLSQIGSLSHQDHRAGVCVVGGGLSGLCAAIASARQGVATVLLHDRPVLGGNASSEVRMWVCGAQGRNNQETGLLEELKLDNCRHNPEGNYSLWDHVLYAKAAFQPNLTLLLNTSVFDATVRPGGGRLETVTAWQLTTQTRHIVEADVFIDCSGDSILMPLCGAEGRWGREAREEFGEDIEPAIADRKTMGNTLLIQARQVDDEVGFSAPSWAYRFEDESDLPCRYTKVRGNNFWWLEVGGLDDTIRDSEQIAHELRRLGLGVWDYLKNRSLDREHNAGWALEWMGQLPGKRENRRYVGGHMLTQNEVRDGGRFDDVIAHGGWPMDDHHPAGLYYPDEPTVFHPAPSPFGIPYRCLFSRNVENLMCAGRNISVTHAALSSTRVMGTCAVLGQAAGTAAALATQLGVKPATIYPEHIPTLQRKLMQDDQWLPGVARDAETLPQTASLAGPGDLSRLHLGQDRPQHEDDAAIQLAPGQSISWTWASPVEVRGLRLILDSSLNTTKRMPCSYPCKGNWSPVPGTLPKGLRVESQDPGGAWSTLWRDDDQYRRLRHIPLHTNTTALRLTLESTWGDDHAGIFSAEPTSEALPDEVLPPRGARWSALRDALNPDDLVPPASTSTKQGTARRTGGA